MPYEGTLPVAAYFVIRTILLYNPNFPRACFSRFCQVQRVIDNTILALSEIVPDQGKRWKLGRDPLLLVLRLPRGDGRVPDLP